VSELKLFVSRHVAAQRRKMAKRKGSSAPSCSRARKKADRDAREAENAQRLDKLPTKVWEKILLDELESNDLFPLALSCKYFRQKQKELVEQTRQQRPKSGKPRRHRLMMKTTLVVEPEKGQPASADYVRFCSKEKVRFAEKNEGQRKAQLLRRLAAYHGHLPVLQELQAGLKRLDPDIAKQAARGGQLETLQWLKTQEGFYIHSGAFAFACEGGNWEIIRWLRSEGCPWSTSACNRAAKGGQLEVLKWLRSEGCPWNVTTCSFAAEGGHLDVLKWLKKEGCPWNAGACNCAAEGGHFEVLKWLRSEGCPWNEWACTNAASGGYMEIMYWLMDGEEVYDFRPKCSPNPDSGRYLEILKWLRSEGCPWDEWTCAGAASAGHLDVLKWLRSEGCPWDMSTCAAAALGYHLDVLEWAIDNDCPYLGWMQRLLPLH